MTLKERLLVVNLFASRVRGAERREYIRLATSHGLDKLAEFDLGAIAQCQELCSLCGNEDAISRARDNLQVWAAKKIQCIGLGDPLYPVPLLHTSAIPPLLFYKGNTCPQFASTRYFAIVGSRKADMQSCALAHDIAGALAEQGICVVSGLALGIDGAAHRGALSIPASLSSNCPTIAVLGNGLASIYPSAHVELAQRIVEQGGFLLSQFEPDEKPFPSNFLNRNQIIAGLSCGVLVIQAAERSGALATARFALEAGREVFAMPGSVTDQGYRGSNKLIKSGATVVTEVQDLFDALPQLGDRRQELMRDEAENQFPIGSAAHAIVEMLQQKESVHFDELLEFCGKRAEVERVLLELELGNRILRLPGNAIALRPACR